MSDLGGTGKPFSALLCELGFEGGLSLLDETGVVTASSDSEGLWMGSQPGPTSVLGSFAEVHPDDLPEANRLWQKLLEQANEVRCVLRIKHRDTGWRWIEAIGRNLLKDPQVLRVAIRWKDVTADRQARLIAENARDLIWTITANGTLTFASPGCVTALGEKVVGTDYYQRVHPEDLDAVRSCLQSASLSAETVAPYRCRTADGAWIWLESTVRRLGDSKDSDVLTVARDITHQRLREEEAVVEQKMDAVARLAGGVAHDFNNLLSIITSAGALLHDELPPDHPSQPMTEEIQVACRRAADLTKKLLAFSRRQMLKPSQVSVNELVRASLDEVKGQLGSSIRVEIQLDPEPPMIEVDAPQIERVLVNLILNARDAMPTGGVLTLKTFSLKAQAQVTVEDTGLGMNAVARSHLFEPFYTTKARGKGGGLGLATSYGVIRQSGGQLRVTSEAGKGSAFSLVFPRSFAVAAPAPVASVAIGPTVAVGTETILLVEDDSAVRRVAAALLTKKGYRVIQAEDGRKALSVSDEDIAHVQLLLTDVMMPGMSGPEIASALQTRRPGLRVLFMSGYNNESVQNVLHKPFTLDTLSRRVRETLDQPLI